MDWATRVPHTAERYNVEEIHTAVFRPQGWQARRDPVISIGLPEGELRSMILKDGIYHAYTEHLPRGSGLAKAIFAMIAAAKQHHPALIIINCDTTTQLDRAIRKVGRALPNHCRVPLERALEGMTETSRLN